MLKPSYLEQLPEPLVELVSELENEITSDIAARVVKGKYNTPSSEWLMYKANQLRMSSQSVNRIIAKKAKASEKTVREIYTEAVTTAIKEDMQVYEYAVKDNIISKSEGAKLNTYFRSIAFNDIFRKGLQNTNQLMRNLTGSMAKASGNALIHAMDLAWLEVASGAYTPDEAVYKAVKNLADKGITVVTYEKSGEKIASRRDQVDVAVRRAVRTSINKTCCDMQLDLAGEMGCDLVEVTSHLGARPTHADWQGQVYSLSGKDPKHKPFSVTGYGTGDGLGGWNCRHSFYPYFEGLSERASVPSFTAEENEEYYKLTQKQRALERDIRKSKRELALTDTARQCATDEEWKAKWNRDFERQSATLKRREKRLDDFCKQNNLYPDGSRTRVAGFGKSISQKAVHAAKNYNAAKSAQNTGTSGQGGGSGHAVTVNAVPAGTNGGSGKTYGGQKINKNSLTSGGNGGKINNGNIPNAVEDCKNFKELKKYFKSRGINVSQTVSTLDFASVKESAKGIENVINEFPAASGAVIKIGRFKGTKKDGIMTTNFYGVIKYNDLYYGTNGIYPSDFNKYSSTHIPRGQFSETSNLLASNGNHETGHILERALIMKNSKYTTENDRINAWCSGAESERVVRQAYGNLIVKSPAYVKGKKLNDLQLGISKYAGESYPETLAEAVDDCISNGSNATPLSAEIFKILKGELS